MVSLHKILIAFDLFLITILALLILMTEREIRSGQTHLISIIEDKRTLITNARE